jgi:hypothetical protein
MNCLRGHDVNGVSELGVAILFAMEKLLVILENMCIDNLLDLVVIIMILSNN